MSTSKQTLKQSKIRYTEYYDLQKVLDDLYADSSKNKVFSNLMELITSRENIKLATNLEKKIICYEVCKS